MISSILNKYKYDRNTWNPTTALFVLDRNIWCHIRGAFNKFPDFLYRHLKLSKTLKNSVCYCYTSYEMTDQFLWFQLQMSSYSSNSNTPWLSQLVNFKNAIWTLEERYAIKFCFKLGKMMPEKRMECFRLLFDHLA